MSIGPVVTSVPGTASAGSLHGILKTGTRGRVDTPVQAVRQVPTVVSVGSLLYIWRAGGWVDMPVQEVHYVLVVRSARSPQGCLWSGADGRLSPGSSFRQRSGCR